MDQCIEKEREILKMLKEEQKELMAITRTTNYVERMVPVVDDDRDDDGVGSVPDYGIYSEDSDDDVQRIEVTEEASKRQQSTSSSSSHRPVAR